MTTEEPHCKGQNAAGGPCGARVQPGYAWCQWHDPDREEERRQWRREGGRATSNTARARREIAAADVGIQRLPGVLYRALRKVERGEMDPPVASAMATLSRAIIAATQAAELDDRLSKLEARAGIVRGAA
jgi:hypothetical protein